MTAQALVPTRRTYTIAEYLAMEERATDKHEFRDGEIICMPGGTYTHARITTNFVGELRSRLKGGPCAALDSNMRVRIPRKARYVYPDGSVICGRPAFDADDPKQTTIINPRMIVEVLSPSTERHDRGPKFDDYRLIESLAEYVLIAQDEARVETFFRQPDGGWRFDVATERAGVVRLRSVEVDLPLAEVYEGVEFPEPPAALSPPGQDVPTPPAP